MSFSKPKFAITMKAELHYNNNISEYKMRINLRRHEKKMIILLI